MRFSLHPNLPPADSLRRLLSFVLTDGGLAGLVWGYVVICIGFFLVYTSLAEMASMWVIPNLWSVITPPNLGK